MTKMGRYLRAMRPHLSWYWMCGPLAVWELADPVLRFYGIELATRVPTGIVSVVLVALALGGVFYAGFLAWSEEYDRASLLEEQLANRATGTAGTPEGRALVELINRRPQTRPIDDNTRAMERLAREIRQSRTEKSPPLPKLRAVVSNARIGTLAAEVIPGTNTAVSVTIENPLDAPPSRASNWRLRFRGFTAPASRVQIVHSHTGTGFAEVSKVPLPPGSIAEGLVGFSLGEQLLNELFQTRNWTIEFQDSAGRTQVAEWAAD